MLFLLFGSSGSGKTTVRDALRGRDPSLAVHDADEVYADRHWSELSRHEANEIWLRRAVEYQDSGVDLLLAAQTPFGELLAAPSASLIDGISACLLDCPDDIRVERLTERGAEWLARTPGTMKDYVQWGAWMRRHARDPRWMPHVIRGGDESGTAMRWGRWSAWDASDPRWRVEVIDSGSLHVTEVCAAVLAWIERERYLWSTGVHPLHGWTP